MDGSNQSLKDILESLTLTVIKLNGDILAQYQLADDIENEAVLILGEIYRHKQGWKFVAVGQGFAGGQRSLAKHFDAEIKEDDLKENQITPEEKLTRQSSKEVMINEQKEFIREKLQSYFLPQINRALEKKCNEADT